MGTGIFLFGRKRPRVRMKHADTGQIVKKPRPVIPNQ